MPGFEWERTVPLEWQTDLDQLNPGENVTTLKLVWQPGWPWGPVQRFEVYEIIPAATIERILREEAIRWIQDSMTQGIWKAVKGPDPRTVGQWVRDPDIPWSMGGKRWRSDSLVSHTQWQLHRDTGGLPTRSWIIEGDQGGHAWRLGEFEQAFLLSTGTEPELVQDLTMAWPDPGTQPYADYDQRVLDALAERDQITQWRESLRWDDRVGRDVALDLLDKESKDRHRSMMERMHKWIDHQVGSIISDIPRSQLPALSEFERETEHEDQDEVLANLLEE